MSSNSLNQRLALARATQHSDSQTTASGALPEASCCASFSNYGGHVSLTITHEGQSHGAFALHPDQVKSLLPYLLNEVNGEVGISPLDLAGLEVDAAGSEGINNLVSNDGLELHNRTPAEGDDERSAVGEDGGSSGLEPIEFDRRHSVEVEVGVGGDSGEVHNGLEDSSAQRKAHPRALARWMTRLVGFLPFIRTGRPANGAQDGAQNQQPPEKCGTPSSRHPSQDAAYVLAVIENPAVLARLAERTGIPKEVFHIAASRWQELGYPDLESLHPSSLGNTPSVPPSMPQ